MRIAVPYFGGVDERDARLIRLAEFLGIPAEPIALAPAADPTAFLRTHVPAACDCLVLHPRVLQSWLQHARFDPSLVPALASHFRHILVHGLRTHPFDDSLVSAFIGTPASIQPVTSPASLYSTAQQARPIADAFAGLTHGPVNPANDRVLVCETANSALEPVISIDGQPFMARVRCAASDVFLIAGDDVADLDESLDVLDVPSRFSRLLTHAMALRHAAGAACWRPAGHYASLIIDDPLLRARYGFLNYDSLLRLCREENFHTSIAFIPHNWRRTSPRIAQLFCENADRLSICLHGNDHAEFEFAATDPGLLQAGFRSARRRAQLHRDRTGVRCDEVIIFPQERFSLQAMREARLENFEATVCSTTSPMEHPAHVTLAELCLPALTRYGGFPLFIRNSFAQMGPFDFAFRLFFGRAILIGEHHDLFRDPQRVIAAVRAIHAIAPGIRWVSPASAVAHTFLRRVDGDTETIRAFARTIRLDHLTDHLPDNLPGPALRRIVSWHSQSPLDLLDGVRLDGAPADAATTHTSPADCSVAIPPGTKEVSLLYRPPAEPLPQFTLAWRARAVVRRRLSEFRDNHLSGHTGLLSAARAFQRRFLRI